MKKTLLLCLLLCFTLYSTAQKIPTLTGDLVNKSVKVEYNAPGDEVLNFTTPINTTTASLRLSPEEWVIGETWYDLQTNYSISNRFYIHSDGSMAAVWTRGMEASAFPERGTGYNYFDGTDWGPQPTERIEDRRCGWPSYAAWGPGGEMVVSHNGVEGLEISTRTTKGTGSWNQQNLLGPPGIENDLTWPRMVTSGDNNEFIHLFVNSYVEYAGQLSALLYSRSDDGGATWDPEFEILDGMGADYYNDIGADAYTLASNGNTVALLCADAWYDLFMMKSTDNGDSWDKTVIWEMPYPFFDWDVTITDTFFCVDNSASITVDDNGMAHVVWGISRVLHPEVGGTYYRWNYVEGVGYWNENMPTISNNLDAMAPPQYGYTNSEMVVDENYIGWMQDVDGDGEVTLNTDIMVYRSWSPTTVPTIAVDPDDNVHVIFAGTTETYVVDVYNYKHCWYRVRENGVWGEFEDLTSNIVHIFDECFFPILAGYSALDNHIHYTYNADVSPGLAYSDQHAWQQNRQIHGKIPAPINPGIDEQDSYSGISAVSYPNPVTNIVTFEINLETSANVNIEVCNLTGQVVKEIDAGLLKSGVNKVNLPVSDLKSGIYFYTISNGTQSVTNKMVIK